MSFLLLFSSYQGAIETKEKELEEYNKKRSESSAQLSDYRSAVGKINEAKESCTLELRKYKVKDIFKNIPLSVWVFLPIKHFGG